MAVQNMIPTLWSARLTEQLANINIWLGLTNRNFEGEITAAGDTVRIGTLTTDITVSDYSKNTNIDAAQRATTSTQDLLINQQKYFHLAVDDIDRVQARPSIMDGMLEKAAFAISDEIDSFVQPLFTGGNDVAARTQNVGTSAAKLPVATEANRQAAARAIIRGLSLIKEKMYNGKIPSNAGAFIVISPHLFQVLEEFLAVGTTIDYNGAASTTLRAGLSGNLVGFDVFVSRLTPTANDKHICAVGTRQAVTFASQITSIEGYRPELQFGDAVKGLYVYGGKLVEAQFSYRLNVYID